MDVPEQFSEALRAAGWSEGRRARLPRALVRWAGATHPALPVLRAFSGLRIAQGGPGIDFAKGNLEFGWTRTEEDDPIPQLERVLGTRLVGVGLAHDAHCELFMARDGRCYLVVLGDEVTFDGWTLWEALERLLEGRRGRPVNLDSS